MWMTQEVKYKHLLIHRGNAINLHVNCLHYNRRQDTSICKIKDSSEMEEVQSSLMKFTTEAEGTN